VTLPALAHAQLVDASPKANQTMSASPSEFRLFFSDELIDLGPASNWLKVENAQGVVVSTDSVLNGNQVSAKPTQALKPGKYQLTWRVLSEDGHPIQGNYEFTVTSAQLLLQKTSHTQKTVTLSFSQKLETGTKVTVTGPGSKSIKGTVKLTNGQAVFSFASKPAAGKYVVYYLAKSSGGLTLRGNFSITYR
jgi:methionine-rich copper-binding protein CopC